MSRQSGQYSPAPAAASFAAAGEGGDLGTVEARIMARVQAICSPTRKTRVSQLMKVGVVSAGLPFAACAAAGWLQSSQSLSQPHEGARPWRCRQQTCAMLLQGDAAAKAKGAVPPAGGSSRAPLTNTSNQRVRQSSHIELFTPRN